MISCLFHLYISPNTVRVEYRIRKAKKVRDAMGHQSVPSLLFNWEVLTEIYEEEITKMFPYTINSHKQMDELEWFQQQYRKKAMNEYIKWKAMTKMQEEMSLSEFE